MAETSRTRDALCYIMTGMLFDGRKAAEMGLVDEAVPKEELRDRVRALADVVLEKSPAVLKGAKDALKSVRQFDWDLSEDYRISKQEQVGYVAGKEREQGSRQSLDERTFKPGLGTHKRPPKKQDVGTLSESMVRSNAPAMFEQATRGPSDA